MSAYDRCPKCNAVVDLGACLCPDGRPTLPLVAHPCGCAHYTSLHAALRAATEQVRVLTGERDRQYEENVERIAKEQVERARAEKAEAALEKTREAFEEVWPFYEGEHYYDHPCSVRVRALIEQADVLTALAAKPEAADHG